MTFDQFRSRKWMLTGGVFAVSAVGLFTGHVNSDDWRYIAIALTGAYALDQWRENQ